MQIFYHLFDWFLIIVIIIIIITYMTYYHFNMWVFSLRFYLFDHSILISNFSQQIDIIFSTYPSINNESWMKNKKYSVFWF